MAPKAIKGDGFKGNDPLSLAQWRSLEVVSSASAPSRLLKNWSGQITGYLICSLSADNKSIRNLSFHLGGSLWENENAKHAADSFWDDLVPGSNFSFAIPALNTALFSFPEGGLTSDLLDHSALRVNWFKDDATISPEQREEAGIPGFSLRCHIIPKQVLSSGTWGTVYVTLLPLPRSQLLELHPLCKSPAFPCFKIYAGHSFPIGFQTSSVLDGLDYGCPLLPAVLAGSDWEDLPFHPPANELQAAIALTMRKVTLPDVKKEVRTLKKAWEDLKTAGETGLKNTNAALKLLWPPPRVASASTPQGM